MSPALEAFFLHVVRPAIDVQPWTGMKQHQLEVLLGYMRNDPNTPACDLSLVKAVVTGTVARHPAVHGMLAALASKLEGLETGKTTMRNNSRALDVSLCWRILFHEFEGLGC